MLENRRRVLIVDDESDVRLFVRTVLEAEGWLISEAVNGQDAIDQANENVPDLVVLDVMMPVKNGFDTFRELREGIFTQHVPVVILTAMNRIEQASQWDESMMEQRCGVSRPEGFVDKPVDPVFLVHTINGAVR